MKPTYYKQFEVTQQTKQRAIAWIKGLESTIANFRKKDKIG